MIKNTNIKLLHTRRVSPVLGRTSTHRGDPLYEVALRSLTDGMGVGGVTILTYKSKLVVRMPARGKGRSRKERLQNGDPSYQRLKNQKIRNSPVQSTLPNVLDHHNMT